MANIGYDAKRAFKNFSGLGNYSRALISSLARFYQTNDYFLYTPQYKENSLFEFANRDNIFIKRPSGIYNTLPTSLWRSRGIISDLQRDKIDIYHGLSGELPSSNISIPKVVTMHDVIFLRYPEYYKPIDRWIYEKKFKAACKSADKIIAISQQTADDLILFLGADHSKIEIIYQGCDKQFYNTPSEADRDRVKEKYNLPDKFILNVGTIEKRKNLANIIKALKKVPEDVSLVALGRATPYITEVEAAIKENNLQNRVQIVSGADFEDFPAIYSQAKALTYISVFEGFGIPVLEGLNAKIPVITSNISSMPEAGGDAAIYVDPLKVEEISEAINMVLSSPTLVETMQVKGLAHAAKFREDVVSKEIADLYQTLL